MVLDQLVDHGSLVLPAEPASVPTSRRFVAERLADLPDAVVGDAVLLVSELATNCVRHARSPFRISLHSDGRAVRVDVSDHSSEQARAVPERDSRGLLVVDRVASAWGSEPVAGGKVVWFELPTS